MKHHKAQIWGIQNMWHIKGAHPRENPSEKLDKSKNKKNN